MKSWPYEKGKKFFSTYQYNMAKWDEFDFSVLNYIPALTKTGKGAHSTYSDCFISADTETSKKPNSEHNHVCAWTISIRAFNKNIVTLYGTKPSDMVECFSKIRTVLKGEEIFVYFHNLSYDWVFLRKFMFQRFGVPEKQLNTKPHYPINIKFQNGIFLKDSYILAQRSLEKWANDLNVEHKKAVGCWDYTKIRNQDEEFTLDELKYIENDTLALVECLDKMKINLHKKPYSMPFTATGIPREEVRKIGQPFQAHEHFTKMALTYDENIFAESVYHGGFTHANRHLIDITIYGSIKCFDLSSSYPYCLLSEKYPCEKFHHFDGQKSIDWILTRQNKYAFMFTLVLIRPRLKNDRLPMPALQFYKCTKTINAVTDNGRILCADYLTINLTEIDLSVIAEQYDWDGNVVLNIMCARKAYLPRWFTDYVFECYKQKTLLKGGDKVAYALAKSRINSLYGMCCQKVLKPQIVEQINTMEYLTDEFENPEEEYNKQINKYTSILPYQWGIWCTAYAFRNLFELGKCVDYENGDWIYSDTDSAYSSAWDENKIAKYNQECKNKLKANGYGCVYFNDREYWLGIAEFDGEYSEFRVMGAKRYCGRSTKDGELHITVAGVPKKGSVCLEDDIEHFTKEFIFPGTVTGKLTHKHIPVEDIYIDNNGNETGDSIDLSPCNYRLDSVYTVDWESIFNEEVYIQVYE